LIFIKVSNFRVGKKINEPNLNGLLLKLKITIYIMHFTLKLNNINQIYILQLKIKN